MKFNFNDYDVKNTLSKAEFGLEMESLRITTDGKLSQTKHPFGENKNITRDFCENQVEMITDVFDNAEDMLTQLKEILLEVEGKLIDQGELLWRFSNPPSFTSPDEIPVAEFKGSVYRDYLAEKYGKVKMLMSGIHLNFSLPDESFFFLSGTKENENRRKFKDKFYLELAAKIFSYSWLIVYLTAASPVMDDSFIKYNNMDTSERNRYSSVRCSEKGYWNFFTPILDYSSIEEYVKSVEHYVNNGNIISCSELYYPIRIKPRGKYNLENLLKNGINHIELRMIDLNPLSDIGVFKEDIDFIHLLILYLMSVEYSELNENKQITALNNMKKSALFDDSETVTICGCEFPISSAAALELHKIADFAIKYYPEYAGAVKFQLDKIGNDNRRYASVVKKHFTENYTEKGVALSKKYRRSDVNVHAFCSKLGREI